MLFYLIVGLWLFQIFFGSSGSSDGSRFLLELMSLPAPLVNLYLISNLALFVLFPFQVLIRIRVIKKVKPQINAAAFIAFALALAPVMLINSYLGTGMYRFSPLLFLSGVACNCLAIIANGGKMPVVKEVLERSIGEEIDLELSDEEIFKDCMHSLTREPPKLAILVDRFHSKLVIRRGVFSIGDVLIALGMLIIFWPR